MTAQEMLTAAFLEAVGALDFAGAVREGVASSLLAPPDDAGRIGVGEGATAPEARVLAIAIGKAAPQMMQGALEALGERIARTVIVCPDGTPVTFDADEILRAGHPFPDERSVAAAARLLELAGETTPSDVLLVLVSGGASALACAPHAGITFETKLAVTGALLRAGATIVEFNTVRRHLSRFKGGGLTRAARGPVIGLLASDVIGGAPHDIGSGPTAPDPTTIADARAILAQYAPEFSSLPLVASLAPQDEAAAREQHAIVIEPETLADHAVRALTQRGFACARLAASLSPV
ncbi:MAG TPA: glycerate-2-kinase family protein, partial [Polyangiaceae bacterium]|nr:glycerate-2-kinase family protein [Polyangiaceae bacterium]